MILDLSNRPTMRLLVDGAEYTLDFPLAAIIKAEEKLGRKLTAPADWFTAPAKDISVFLEVGLSKYGDEAPAIVSAIQDRLDPETYAELAEALGALAFPKFTARYKENLERLRAGGSPEVQAQ